MAKIFTVPFATTGDKTAIPDPAQGDSSVSYTSGYTSDYALDPATNPGAKNIEREKFNALMNDVTAAIFELQKHGFSVWTADVSPCPIGAMYYYNSKVWQSKIANNNATPAAGASWAEVNIAGALMASQNLSDLANAGTARANLGLGDAATRTVTTGVLDTTAGLLLQTRDFGIGVAIATTADLNTLVIGGNYYATGSANRPPGTSNGYLTVVPYTSSVSCLQIYREAVTEREFQRRLRAGVWGNWVEQWTTDNLKLETDIVTESGTAWTIGATHVRKWTRASNGAAITVTVPTNATYAAPIGSQFIIEQAGAGQVTLAPASGVTIRTARTLKTRAQYSPIGLIKIATDEWVASGDLGAA